MKQRSVTDEQRAAKEAVIARAALEAFAERGFASTRVADVAQRAGVAKGTIYLYFENKTKLFEGVVRTHLVPSIASLEGLVAAHEGSAEELLRALIRQIYVEILDPSRSQVMRLLIAEGRSFPDLVQVYFEQVVVRAKTVVGAALERGEESGEFRRTSAKRFPQVVIGPVFMATMWQMLFADHASLDTQALCDAHLDVLFSGLRA